MRPDNLAMLKDTPTPVVLLKASATETLRRIGGDSGRPLAQSLDEKGIADMQAQRQVNYNACADLTIKTDGLSPVAIAEEIISFLNLPVSAS